jgi:hypothetical protein
VLDTHGKEMELVKPTRMVFVKAILMPGEDMMGRQALASGYPY